jgi:hypothetical protein
VLTVEPAPSAGGAEPPPMQTVAALDDPTAGVSERSGFSTPMLGIFIAMGLALVVYTGGSLPAKTKAFLAERAAAAAPAVDVKVKPAEPKTTVTKSAGTKPGEVIKLKEEPAPVVVAAGEREKVMLPNLALSYGLFLGGALFLLIPAVSIGRRMFGGGSAE